MGLPHCREVHRPELREGPGILPGERADAFTERTFRGLAKGVVPSFPFADEQHAETFMKEFGGERMPPQKEARANAGLIGKRDIPTEAPKSV